MKSSFKTKKITFWLRYKYLILFIYIIINPYFFYSLSAQYQPILTNQLLNEYGLTGGTWLVGTSETNAINTIAGVKNSNCPTLNIGSIQNHHLDLPFEKQAIVTNGCSGEASPWDSYLNLPVENIDVNDNLLLVFWTKGISELKKIL